MEANVLKGCETIHQGNLLDNENPAELVGMYKREPRKIAEILVIEDNPGDVRLLEEVFRELGADVHLTVARDGAEGLEMVMGSANGQRLQPDLILLDLNLPKV